MHSNKLPFSRQNNDNAVIFAALASKWPDRRPPPNLMTFDDLALDPIPESVQNIADSLSSYEPRVVELTTLAGASGGDDIEARQSDGQRDRQRRRSRCLRWGYWTLLLTIFMAATGTIQVFLAWMALSKVSAPVQHP